MCESPFHHMVQVYRRRCTSSQPCASALAAFRATAIRDNDNHMQTTETMINMGCTPRRSQDGLMARIPWPQSNEWERKKLSASAFAGDRLIYPWYIRKHSKRSPQLLNIWRAMRPHPSWVELSYVRYAAEHSECYSSQMTIDAANFVGDDVLYI